MRANIPTGVLVDPHVEGTDTRLFAGISVIFLVSLLWAQSAQPGGAPYPGDAPYTPTKLEWAALELLLHGRDYGEDHHFSMSFSDSGDGRSVECLLIYDHAFTAAQSKAARDLCQMHVADFAKGKGWDWLRVRIEEQPMPF